MQIAFGLWLGDWIADAALACVWFVAREHAQAEYIAGDIERISGVLRLTLLLPHGQNPSQAVLLELPQELTVTYRLRRHLQESTGWRLNVAKWFIPLLDPYDPSGKNL